jgi:streptogramin lyase
LIAADQKGHIWYSLGFTGSLGEYDPATDTSTNHFPQLSCTNSANGSGCTHISGVAVDPKGNIWFTDALNDSVGYYIPTTNKFVTKKLAAKARPHDGLAIDPYGTVWIAQQSSLMLTMWPNGKIPTA